ncbi:MAG TPA: prolyl-tRNA synthetase associated domain-containing protein [Levilinea sp.]|nr:prolyl-tRNA synthetase associated domain-containing protein [Levilinea sp.]
MSALQSSPSKITTEASLLAWLDQNAIPYGRVEHPPVFTCQQADRYRPSLPAAHTKNLFLRDRHSRYYLLMTCCEKPVDLKALGYRMGVTKLHFGSEEKLLDLLGVTPGAVTLLGLVNDTQRQVQCVVDAAIWREDNFLCHPLVNTATLLLARSDMLRFFELTGHEPQVVDVPAREPGA